MNTKTGIERAIEIAGSQSDLARLIGVPAPRVNNWAVLGYVPALKGRAAKVAEVTGVPVNDLLRPEPRKTRVAKSKAAPDTPPASPPDPPPQIEEPAPHVPDAISTQRPVQYIGRLDRGSTRDIHRRQG